MKAPVLGGEALQAVLYGRKPPIMENQTEKNMENEMATDVIQGFIGSGVSQT